MVVKGGIKWYRRVVLNSIEGWHCMVEKGGIEW